MGDRLEKLGHLETDVASKDESNNHYEGVPIFTTSNLMNDCCLIEEESPWRLIAINSYQIIVDATDYEFLIKTKWYVNNSRYGRPFAFRKESDGLSHKKIWMHREVMIRHGRYWEAVYHHNGNSLDNRWCNLREVVPKEMASKNWIPLKRRRTECKAI